MRGKDSQRHAVDNQLHRQVLAISGSTVRTKSRLRPIVLAVPVDQVPHDLVQHGRPDGSDGVHAPEVVDIGVLVGVCGQRGGVWVCADTLGVVGDPRAHGVVLGAGVTGLQADGGCHKVAPALAHATRLECAEAVGVSGAAGQTVGDTVSVLVDDNTGFEAGVAVGCGQIPEEHAHAAGLAIWWGGKVGVVGV